MNQTKECFAVIVGVAPSTSPPESAPPIPQNNNKGESKKQPSTSKHKHRNSSSEDKNR